MELKDYTEEQLRAELKRRYDERQKRGRVSSGVATASICSGSRTTISIIAA